MIRRLLGRARADARFVGFERGVRTSLRRSPLGPPLLRWRLKRWVAGLPPELEADARHWSARVVKAQDSAPLTPFDVVLDVARHSVGNDRAVELLAIPLALRARTVVELGCAMSYYDLGASYAAALRNAHEGMMSTRVLGTACALLRQTGTEASLISVDIREWPERDRSLMHDLGFGDLWTLHQGTDSVGWLQAFEGTIDVLLVDSNHTYQHVRAELEAAASRMSERSAIIVDNCYTMIYRTGSSYMADDDAEGIAHGGEYGAILEFLDAHPEWRPAWKRHEVMVMTRGWDIPTVAVPRS